MCPIEKTIPAPRSECSSASLRRPAGAGAAITVGGSLSPAPQTSGRRKVARRNVDAESAASVSPNEYLLVESLAHLPGCKQCFQMAQGEIPATGPEHSPARFLCMLFPRQGPHTCFLKHQVVLPKAACARYLPSADLISHPPSFALQRSKTSQAGRSLSLLSFTSTPTPSLRV